jgi:hypothetical protein
MASSIGRLNRIAAQGGRLGQAASLLGKAEIGSAERMLGQTSRHIASFTEHGMQRATQRGVSENAIFGALANPLKVKEIKIDHLGRPSQRFIGREAEVVINPSTNQIVSVNPTSTKKVDKLIKDQQGR